MIEMTPTTGAGEFRMGFAGDTMNTAWYLRRLLGAQHHVEYFTALGDDAMTEQMLTFLRSAGLGVDHVLRRRDRTVGLYLVHLNDGERSFSYWRGESAARTLAQDESALTSALDKADWVYFSGITLAILQPADRARLRAALSAVKARGGEVIFDPNLRPALWADPQQMRDEVMAGAALSKVVLPSFEDEAAWFKDRDPEATAARYAGLGVQTIVVKNGAGPILTWHAGTASWHDPVVIETVLDTTAAGDSFNAGFLASFLNGGTLPKAVHEGARIASQVIRSRGALVPVI